MAAHIIATVNVTDGEAFGRYVKAIAGLQERFGGEYLVRGAVADMLEGEASPGERVVVLRFPTEQQARGFIASPEYQAGKLLRSGAATLQMRLLVDAA